mmetsp:Transcript_14408/g.31228  ORF Transcript_14408/g.31228 Transcript_14408/m.31228 type:complete len:88 (-) Transcript_14408:234-497(-)
MIPHTTLPTNQRRILPILRLGVSSLPRKQTVLASCCCLYQEIIWCEFRGFVVFSIELLISIVICRQKSTGLDSQVVVGSNSIENICH